MLIKIKAHTGAEFVNPEQISHVSAMRGYMLMHMVNQAMLPIDLVEWDEIKDRFVRPDNLEERYYDMLNALYRQSGRIEELEAEIYSLKHPQAPRSPSADDPNGSTTGDDGLPF